MPVWSDLWAELVGLNDRWLEIGQTQEDHWMQNACAYAERVEQRWSEPDRSRALLVDRLRSVPGATLLDIGAGTGAWAALAARHAAAVTAVERSQAMTAVMRQNLAAGGINNVRVVQGNWPDVDVGPHDFSLCAHAMYGAPDLPGFIRRMTAVTRRACFLLMRAPRLDGLMPEFARLVLGHPYDSPSFIVAYHVLIEMGIYADVLFEDTGLRRGWTHASIAEALAEVKRRLGLKDDPAYDEIITRRLRAELAWVDGKYVWPPSTRSVLVHWEIA